jgi:hypothetical protein
MGNDAVTFRKRAMYSRARQAGRGVQAPDGKEGWISTKVIRETD